MTTWKHSIVKAHQANPLSKLQSSLKTKDLSPTHNPAPVWWWCSIPCFGVLWLEAGSTSQTWNWKKVAQSAAIDMAPPTADNVGQKKSKSLVNLFPTANVIYKYVQTFSLSEREGRGRGERERESRRGWFRQRRERKKRGEKWGERGDKEYNLETSAPTPVLFIGRENIISGTSAWREDRPQWAPGLPTW